MKKKIFLLTIMFICPSLVFAQNKIYNIDMDIYIDESGNADITEIWDVDGDDGSEWYKVMNNLDGSEVTNYSVLMDGKQLEYKEWDIDENLSQKKGYYGINYTNNGLELCFGKGDYNRHTFTLNYKLSNFIINTSDSQVLQWRLIDSFTDVDFDKFTIIVHSYYEFPDELEVWGYGVKGYTYVKDGKIYATTEENTKMNDNYYAMLVKFPLDTFNTEHKKEGIETFNDIYENGNKDIFEYNYNESSFEKIIDKVFFFLTYLIPIITIFETAKAVAHSGYGYKDNKTIDKKNTPMFRDIPCNKDIYYANTLTMLNNFGYREANIFGAILLKWIRQNKIVFKNETKGIFNKETSVIDLTLNPTFDDPIEKELFDIMYKASGDGILESKELEKWCRKNYSRFFSIFTKITNREVEKLKRDNHIYTRTDKKECKKKNVMDDKIYEDSTKLYGLKKYLQEFSNMKTKEAIEVKLWDEYLMFAYIFGIADKVAKQFKNLYPEIVSEMEAKNLDYGTFIYINHLSTTTVSAASAARSAAESYSSGGGGFNMGGGGGGFSGGGGGGSR